ncbi:uncharacterized protein HKW66_Vig0222270 [Vigna angularis]|uniref:Uncharacterized protein n=1 Tax=Phaseolus angularis TaxID=3914 RepID=A0A8T0K018_PHAAN|nr:uncharacterized protein LOC108337025 [Vigna angularis]KAG2390367.1 uncharacterized protein HKW66_Vig0222270 [Vigna angularis]
MVTMSTISGLGPAPTIAEPSSSKMPLTAADSGSSLGFIFFDKGLWRFRMLPSDNSWCDSTRTLPCLAVTHTRTMWTVRIGGLESVREVSPWESLSQRLCTFLVSGLTLNEAKDSEERRGLSQSERDWGDAKLWGLRGRVLRAVAVVVFLEGVAVRDTTRNLRKRQRVEAMLG